MTSAPGTRKLIYYVHWDDEGNVLENITAQWFPKKSIRNKYITDQMGKSFKSELIEGMVVMLSSSLPQITPFCF